MSDMPKIELDLERAAPPPAAQPVPAAIPPQVPPARPYAPPQAPLSHMEAPSYRTAALRMAGLILLLNIGLSAWLLGQGQKGGLMTGSLVVDAIITPMLLMGKDSVRRWALVRSVLGLFVGSILAYTAADASPYAWIAVVLNALYCGGLILLLMGDELGLGRLIAGGSLSGVSLLLILGALAFTQSLLNREPTTQTAFHGRVSLLGFRAFSPQSGDLPPTVAAKFDEVGMEQAVSPAGVETVWVYRPKAGITLNPDKALQSAFQGFQTAAGSERVTAPEPRSESHGSLDGEGLGGTLTLKGRTLQARMFISEQGGAYWMFLVLLPSERDPAMADRILDSIQINA